MLSEPEQWAIIGLAGRNSDSISDTLIVAMPNTTKLAKKSGDPCSQIAA